eukprot:SM000012S25352  [mRNA]  locus=s12:487181:488073:- [translate_table: standard]
MTERGLMGGGHQGAHVAAPMKMQILGSDSMAELALLAYWSTDFTLHGLHGAAVGYFAGGDRLSNVAHIHEVDKQRIKTQYVNQLKEDEWRVVVAAERMSKKASRIHPA